MSNKPTYLIFVSEDNHNKYYNMFPQGNSFRVEYGRVNVTKTEQTYPMSDWDKKYKEKIKKGYTDISDTKQELIESVNPSGTATYKQIDNASVRAIVEKLQKLAREAIDKNYTVKASAVTQTMIDKAQTEIDNLGTFILYNDVKGFNACLIALFQILPRKMAVVNDYLAHSVDAMDKIVSREQSLLDVMKGQVYKPEEHKDDGIPVSDKTVLEENNLIMEEGTAEDIRIVKRLMDANGSNSSGYFRKVWKVTNTATQKAFDDFVKSNNIKDTRLLFHGSRTENFWSIMRMGMKLRPNAKICGKMFGSGLYFAPKCRKSMGYTSLSGSYWVGGGDRIAYMAIFDTAYGTPYHTDNNREFFYDYGETDFLNRHKGYNCVHAHAGAQLQNDEIIFYNEHQVTIKYLIEIGN